MKKNIKEVKDNLKFILLHSNFNYDLMIYRIIDDKCLDFYLPDIDDSPVTNNVTNTTISANEQVIKLLDRFFFVLKNDFIASLPHQEFIIEKIINSNKNKMSEFLKLKNNLDSSESNNIVTKKIYMIILNNFCENAEYIPELNKLMSDLGIDFYKRNNTNLLKIRKLLIDIINCNQKEYHTIYLFSNINYDIKKESLKEKDSKKSNQISNQIINNYKNRYSILLDNYCTKKSYLKIFE